MGTDGEESVKKTSHLRREDISQGSFNNTHMPRLLKFWVEPCIVAKGVAEVDGGSG